MPVQVVFSFFGKKLHCPDKPFASLDRLGQRGVGKIGIQQIGFPSYFSRRMGVGIGNKSKPVQCGDPPVHGRVGGKAGLHGMDVFGKIAETLFHRVKTGKGAEHRKVGRPDMGGDKNCLGAGLQRNFQKIPAVQPQNGPPIGMDVADAFQPVGTLRVRPFFL